MKSIFFIGVFFLCGKFLCAEEYRIVAKVNNKIITTYDLSNRIGILMLSAGLKETDRLKKELSDQALQDLINENLQIDEAEKEGITEDEQKINTALENIEERLPGSKSDKEKWIESLRLQFRAQSVWTVLVRKNFASLVSVSDDEVESYRKDQDLSKNKKRYLVSEIFISYETSSEQEALNKAQDIILQVRQSVPFYAVAEQVSESPSAKKGGDLGWITLEESPIDLRNILKKGNIGDVSDPLKDEDKKGYFIYKIRDTKTPGTISFSDQVLNFSQILLPKDLDDAGIHLHLNNLSEAKTCADFESSAKAISGGNFKNNDNIPSESLPLPLQDLFRGLKVQEKSQPIKTPDGILLFMLCSSKEKEEKELSKEQIVEILEQKRFSLAAKKYLKELHSNAHIEIMQ